MSYGIEVKNASGRTIFNTDQQYPNYYVPGTITSSTSYGVTPNPQFSTSSDDILIARPPDDTSGTVFLSYYRGTSGTDPIKFHGVLSREQTLGAAQGVKYTYLKRQDQTGTGAITTGTGYGVEVFKSNGTDLQYSSNHSTNVEIIQFGRMSGNTSVTYTHTGNDFNNIYVAMAPLFHLKTLFFPDTTGFLYDYYQVEGAWAIFNNTAKTITFRHGRVYSFSASYSAGFGTFSEASGSSRDYIIFRLLQ